MAFTTWSALKTQILDDIAGGSVLVKSYSVGTRTRVFQNMAEVIEFLKFCDDQITYPTTTRTGRAIKGITPC